MIVRRVVPWLAIAAIAFGAVTLYSGGQVLFGGQHARAEAGQVVPFVLWFNFCAGFVYILTGAGLLRRSRWAVHASLLLGISTILVALALGIHILAGGAFEMRTLGAMAIRSLFWATVFVVLIWVMNAPSQRRS